MAANALFLTSSRSYMAKLTGKISMRRHYFGTCSGTSHLTGTATARSLNEW